MDSRQAGPFAPFEWMLSARYLRARRKEGFVSVITGFSFLGIMLGVATLIIVMAVMNGFRAELLGKILGFNGHIVAQPLETPLTDWKDVAARIGQVEGIRLAVPVVDGPALASSSNASGVLVRGIRAEDLNRLSSIAGNIKHGSIDHFDEVQGVAIGRGLADQLSVQAGDSITLVAQRGAVTPMGVMPRVKKYQVAAVFEIGMSEYDSGVIFMPIAEAQAFFNRDQDVTAIEIFMANPDRIDQFRKTVAEAAGLGHGGTEPGDRAGGHGKGKIGHGRLATRAADGRRGRQGYAPAVQNNCGSSPKTVVRRCRRLSCIHPRDFVEVGRC